MATESTQIARASHQDSRALRVIQILSMLFLPASLVSSIFGMGFFSTSQGANGQANFVISKSWWLYVAISIPLIILCLTLMGGYNVASKLKARQRLPSDTEEAPSNQLKRDRSRWNTCTRSLPRRYSLCCNAIPLEENKEWDTCFDIGLVLFAGLSTCLGTRFAQQSRLV